MNDEGLNIKINKFIRRKTYIAVLKGLKMISDKKYMLIRVYYFIMKNSYKNFLTRIVLAKNNMNNTALKKLSVLYNYTIHIKSFFRWFENRKRDLQSKKDSLVFLSYKLKTKFFQMIKKYYYSLKVYRDKVSYIYTNYLKERVLKYLKRFYYNRYNRAIVRKFILTQFFKKLHYLCKAVKAYKPLTGTIITTQQLMALKAFRYRLNLAYCTRLSSNTIRRSMLKFVFRTFLSKVKRYNKIIGKLERNIKQLTNDKINTFFNKVRNRLSIKKQLHSKAICLNDKVNKISKQLYFRNFYNFYTERLEKEYYQVKKFYERLFYMKLKYYTYLDKRLLTAVYSVRTDNCLIKQLYKTFFKNFQKQYELHKNKNKANEFRKLQLARKFLDMLREIYIIHITEKEKYIKALLNFRKNFIRKLFNALINNQQYQLDKRRRYNEVFKLRHNVIEENMIRLLISNCTKEMKQKDDIITNLYVKRTTRGIKTVLKWYQILKSRINMKRLNKKQPNENKSEQMLLIDKIELEKDVETLLTLRNKKRERPKLINIIN
jgi:hypothetical protein